MAIKNYTTKTGALKATIADINKLEAKKLKVNGKDVVLSAKHANDTRETVTENDLWGQYIETLKGGTAIVHDDWVTNPNLSNSIAWDESITKVEDNKAYVGDIMWANVQTEKIKDGRSFFYMCSALTSFVGNLENLKFGGGETSVSDGMFRSCINLESFVSDLSSLIDGGSMFSGCNILKSFTSDDLSSLINGKNMFNSCWNLESFTSNLSSLANGENMFYDCDKLKSFTSDDLSSLIDGTDMFMYCGELESFTSNLSSLIEGSHMFHGCYELNNFVSDLSSLSDGNNMFYDCSALTAFIGDLSSLINGDYMFHDCNSLESFTSDLSSLINGNRMFDWDYNLKSFTSDLSSLVSGEGMFCRTKLTPQSVMYIVDSINDLDAEKKLYGTGDGKIPYVTREIINYSYKYSAPQGFMSDGKYVYTYNTPNPYTDAIMNTYVGKLTLGIDVTNNSSTIKQQLEDFAKAATFNSWEALKKAFVDKGWTVIWQYGSGDVSIPYDLRGGERIIPCPVYTQLIEISPKGVEYDEEGNETGNMVYTNDQKNSAEYTNEDGTKFYSINWGHDVTNYDDFQQFDSLEDAAAAYGVILNQTTAE